MKLPKQIPVNLLSVLLVILIFTTAMDKPSDTKEDFDMKQIKDVKNMLMNKMGNLIRGTDNEHFKPFDSEEEKQSVTPWLTMMGSPIQKIIE